MKERLREFLQSKAGGRVLVVGAAAVMVLLMLSTVSCEGNDSQKQDVSKEAREYAAEVEQTLEKRLEQLLEKIEGAGSVSVMVTLDTTEELVYEKDTKTENSAQSDESGSSENRSSETEAVLYGSSKSPLQIGTVLPKVRGAAVVCKGASDPVIRERVVNTVASALNIGTSRVYVTC